MKLVCRCNDETVRAGFVIAIDLLPIAQIEGAVTLGGVDFTNALNQSRVLSVLGDRRVDLVMSDMAPNATGIQAMDHERIVELALSALQFATQVLRPKSGHFLCKLWDGEHLTKFQKQIFPRLFNEVHVVKPPASREHSGELFVLGKHFKGIVQ
jgi:23S rRNA (uridine2552-2'-O)-methyltransferase